MKIFAFGLGDEAVDKSIGEFKLRRESRDAVKYLEIELCSDNEFCALKFENHHPETLYFAKNLIEDSDENKINQELVISFEICSGKPECADSPQLIDDYLDGKTFHFPSVQYMFDSSTKSVESWLTTEIEDNLIYPYLAYFKMEMGVDLEKGVIRKDLDAIGINSMFGQKDVEPFLVIGEKTKNYYPRNDSATVPVELRLRMSKKAHSYDIHTYMLADWLIDVGGISKAFYFAGKVICHFVALRAYKAALIGDVFMVQNKSEAEKKEEEKEKEDLKMLK